MKGALKVINELKKEGLFEDYAIGGGIATLFYIEPFLTYDLDVFIILSKEKKNKNLILLNPLFDNLRKKGYSFKGEHIIIEGIPVQFIPGDELEEEGIKNAKEIAYEKIKTRVLLPEYLIAILLRSGRGKDIEKVKGLLKQTEVKREQLNLILERYGLTETFKSLRGLAR